MGILYFASHSLSMRQIISKLMNIQTNIQLCNGTNNPTGNIFQNYYPVLVFPASNMADNFEHSMTKEIVLSTSSRCLLVKWKVATNQKVPKGSILAVYKICSGLFHESDLILLPKLKSDIGGRVNKLLVGEGEEVQPGLVNRSIYLSFL